MTATDGNGTMPQEEPAAGGKRVRLIRGPGMLLVWLYGVMVVGAVSRSAVQISTEFDKAPLAYSLSAVAGLVYGFITYSLVRGGETARRAALVCCAAELAGVLIVGPGRWRSPPPSRTPRCGPTTGWLPVHSGAAAADGDVLAPQGPHDRVTVATGSLPEAVAAVGRNRLRRW